MHTRAAHVTFQHLGIFDRIAHQGIGRSFRSLQFRARRQWHWAGSVSCRESYPARAYTDGPIPLKGSFCTRATSLMANLVAIVPYVMMCATFSDHTSPLPSGALRHARHHQSPHRYQAKRYGRDSRNARTEGRIESGHLRDTQAIGHRRTGSRTTSRTYRHAQLMTGGIDKVLHNQEVSRETHRLHDVQLKVHTLLHLLRQGFTI